MVEKYTVRVYADRTVKTKVTDRMTKLRKDIEKLPKEKIEKILNIALGASAGKISIKRHLDILFSETTENPDDEPGLIYVGRLEAIVRKVKNET